MKNYKEEYEDKVIYCFEQLLLIIGLVIGLGFVFVMLVYNVIFSNPSINWGLLFFSAAGLGICISFLMNSITDLIEIWKSEKPLIKEWLESIGDE